MPQAVLHTPRLALIPLSDEHLEYEVELDSDWDDPIPGSEHGEVAYAITRERWLDLQRC